MSEIKLKKGDKVVMHTCLESKGKNLGKVWTCRTDSFKCEAGIEVVFLEGFSGFFYTKFLQPVKLDSFCNERINSLEASLLDVSTQATKRIGELEEENAGLKSKIGMSIDCEKAQKNGELCLGYGGDEDEPCERCKNCIKCEGGYYQLGETEKDEKLAKAEEIIRTLYYIIQGRIDYENNIQIKDSMDLAKAFLNEVK